MPRTRLITLTGNAELEADVAARLSARPDVELVLRCVDRIEVLAAIRAGAVDAIVSVGAPYWLDRQSAEEAARAAIPLVAMVSESSEADRLASLGAVLVPIDAPVEALIERCTSSDAIAPLLPSLQPNVPIGRLVAVWGPKGAPGRTTLALEMACEIAQTEPNTLLVDCDTYGGDMIQLLGIAEELPTIVWAASLASKEQLDATRMEIDLRRVGKDGPILLPGLPRSELWPDVSDFGWRELLNTVRASFHFTLCDVGFCLEPEATPYGGVGDGRNRLARTTVSEADRVVAVCRADPVGVKSFLWSFDQVRELTDVDRIVVVANRVRAGEEREIGDVLRRHIGKRPIAYVPDRPQEALRATMAGLPISASTRGAAICSALRAVTAALGGRSRARGVLSALSGRR